MATDVELDGMMPGVGINKSHEPLLWPHRVVSKSCSGAAEAVYDLEIEISALRREMEDAFVECASFTSEPVMSISRMLDVKINEYMKVMLKG